MLSQADFEKKYAGTISEGTLNHVHLVHAFKNALRELVEDDAKGITWQTHALMMYQRFDVDYLDELYNQLAIIGDEYGYWFSAHPDDGADFGFWKLEE